MIVSPPITPPAESPPAPSFAGVVNPPIELIDQLNEQRLIPVLRNVLRNVVQTQTGKPVEILALAAEWFFFAARGLGPGIPSVNANVLANACADLAVTGRMSYEALRLLDLTDSSGQHMRDIKETTRLKLIGSTPTDAEIAAAVEKALDRAYDVAWALRGPVAQRAMLREPLGWIAVSSEDDKAHRPVNMPAPSFRGVSRDVALEQYEMDVITGPVTVSTRFFVASTNPAQANAIPKNRRQVPPDPNPAQSIPSDHEVILFLHGHSSGAEEALDIIPHLLEEGVKCGKKYSIVSFDLPNNGYSQIFDHTKVALPDATNFPFLLSDNTPIMTPILDFIEDFVVSFVDALNEVTKVDGTSTIKDRFAAVIGGSLGGNLGLRLGRRMPMPQWLNQAIVSWSPASVWQPMVKHATRSHGPKGAMDRYKEREVDESRREYFNLAYDKEELPGVLKAQSTYWYRDGFTNAAALIRLSRIARQEIYNEYFRQWHWRVACEQLIFSHAANVVYGDSSTPVRYTLNVVPTLLAAGEKDNYTFTGIYDGTRFIGERMPQTPGQLLLIRDTGHSIHTERPAFFASKIVEFLRGLKPDATIAALVPVQVLLEYDQLNKLEKDPYLAALVPARVLL